MSVYTTQPALGVELDPTWPYFANVKAAWTPKANTTPILPGQAWTPFGSPSPTIDAGDAGEAFIANPGGGAYTEHFQGFSTAIPAVAWTETTIVVKGRFNGLFVTGGVLGFQYYDFSGGNFHGFSISKGGTHFYFRFGNESGGMVLDVPLTGPMVGQWGTWVFRAGPSGFSASLDGDEIASIATVPDPVTPSTTTFNLGAWQDAGYGWNPNFDIELAYVLDAEVDGTTHDAIAANPYLVFGEMPPPPPLIFLPRKGIRSGGLL
jgi:hypothetical protein